jgi:MFS family permease
VLAPIAAVGLSKLIGWREAVAILGAAGLIAAALLHAGRAWIETPAAAATRRTSQPGTHSPLTSRPVLLCFAYFVLISVAQVGLQSFSVPATMAMFGLGDTAAASSLTLFLVGASVGVVFGAIVTDRTERHDRVAAIGLALAAAFVAVAVAEPVPAAQGLPVLMFLAGFCLGATGPSRDSIVRQATPPGSAGRVYGFVYSGLDLGGTLAPALFGWLVDHQAAWLVYAVIVAGFALAVGTVVAIRPGAAGNR